MCLDSLATWPQITKHPGARDLPHKVQSKSPFLMLPLGSHAHHIGLKPRAVHKKTTQVPEVQRRQQTRLCCLHFSVSLKQLCTCFSSPNSKIGMAERSAWPLQTCEAFQILTRRRSMKTKKRYKERRESPTGKRKGEGEDRTMPVLLCRI